MILPPMPGGIPYYFLYHLTRKRHFFLTFCLTMRIIDYNYQFETKSGLNSHFDNLARRHLIIMRTNSF